MSTSTQRAMYSCLYFHGWDIVILLTNGDMTFSQLQTHLKIKGAALAMTLRNLKKAQLDMCSSIRDIWTVIRLYIDCKSKKNSRNDREWHTMLSSQFSVFDQQKSHRCGIGKHGQCSGRRGTPKASKKCECDCHE